MRLKSISRSQTQYHNSKKLIELEKDKMMPSSTPNKSKLYLEMSNSYPESSLQVTHHSYQYVNKLFQTS
ncbi:hypothetical protein ACTXT7_000260 [Hymenolepis weldensis]